MLTRDANKQYWTAYDWSLKGEEWTVGFGGAQMEWDFMVRPRIGSYLPAKHILEIGPGFGVWTRLLRPLAERMTLVDLTPRCIDACRETFGKRRMNYIVNDGRSLTGVADASIDLAFSLHSLVHADWDAMSGYIPELARVLTPGGTAFIHHSNFLEFAGEEMPGLEHGLRGNDVSAELVRDAAHEHGLICQVQELVPWGSHRLVDCLSLIRKGPVEAGVEATFITNRNFFHPAQHALRMAAQYGKSGVALGDMLTEPKATQANQPVVDILQNAIDGTLSHDEPGVEVRRG